MLDTVIDKFAAESLSHVADTWIFGQILKYCFWIVLFVLVVWVIYSYVHCANCEAKANLEEKSKDLEEKRKELVSLIDEASAIREQSRKEYFNAKRIARKD